MEVRIDPTSGRMFVNGSRRPDIITPVMLGVRSSPGPGQNARQLSTLLKAKQDGDIIEALRILEPSVRRVEVLVESHEPSIYLDLGGDSLVPLTVSGEGMVRLFSIILGLVSARSGVLLIDEIDNGLHYSVMPGFWKLMDTLTEKHQVQVFATTHNDEILRSALETFADAPGTLGLFRIDRREDRHVMVGYSDEAKEAVLEVPFEVRG